MDQIKAYPGCVFPGCPQEGQSYIELRVNRSMKRRKTKYMRLSFTLYLGIFWRKNKYLMPQVCQFAGKGFNG
jgi:hypothetical protein